MASSSAINQPPLLFFFQPITIGAHHCSCFLDFVPSWSWQVCRVLCNAILPIYYPRGSGRAGIAHNLLHLFIQGQKEIREVTTPKQFLGNHKNKGILPTKFEHIFLCSWLFCLGFMYILATLQLLLFCHRVTCINLKWVAMQLKSHKGQLNTKHRRPDLASRFAPEIMLGIRVSTTSYSNSNVWMFVVT